MIIPEGKQRLVFKMTHIKTKQSVVCTESFIGAWQAEGYELCGYVITKDRKKPITEISPSDIPNNIWQDILTNSAALSAAACEDPEPCEE